MSNRKYAFGFKKLKKKKELKNWFQSQQCVLYKFITIHKKDVTISLTHINMTKKYPLKISNNINTVEQNTNNENIILE